MGKFQKGDIVVFDIDKCKELKAAKELSIYKGSIFIGSYLAGKVKISEYERPNAGDYNCAIEVTERQPYPLNGSGTLRIGQNVVISEKLLKLHQQNSKEEITSMYNYLTGETYNADNESDELYTKWLETLNYAFINNYPVQIHPAVDAITAKEENVYNIHLCMNDNKMSLGLKELKECVNYSKQKNQSLRTVLEKYMTEKMNKVKATICEEFLRELKSFFVRYIIHFSSDVESSVFSTWWDNIVSKKLINFSCEYDMNQILNKEYYIHFDTVNTGKVGYPAAGSDFNTGTTPDDILYNSLQNVLAKTSNSLVLSRYDYDLMLRQSVQRKNSSIKKHLYSILKSLSSQNTYRASVSNGVTVKQLCDFMDGSSIELHPTDYIKLHNCDNGYYTTVQLGQNVSPIIANNDYYIADISNY